MKVTATKTRSEHVVLRKDRNKMKERSGKGPTRTIRSHAMYGQWQTPEYLTDRETWHVEVRSLRGVGKTEQLVNEMERYKMSVLAVMETHLTKNGQVVLNEVKGYKDASLWGQDGKAAEGVGLALAP